MFGGPLSSGAPIEPIRAFAVETSLLDEFLLQIHAFFK